MKPQEVIASISLIAISFLGGWYASTKVSGRARSIENSSAQDLGSTLIRRIVCQGKIVPQGGLINIVSPPGRRIVEIMVANGQPVMAGVTELATYEGQELSSLQSELASSQIEDSKRELEQKILAAESSLSAAMNTWSLAGTQLEQANSAVSLDVSEKQLKLAVEKLDRLKALALDAQTKLYVSQAMLDEQTLAIELSKSQLEAARMQRANAIRVAALNLDIAKAAKEQAAKGLASLLELREENRTLSLTQQISDTQSKSAKLVSPIDGKVLKVFGKPGETISNSPLMQLGNLSRMVCVAEVLDRLVSKIQPNQRVIISSPALPKPIGGCVMEISQIVGSITMMPPNPLAMVDQKTVEVTIDIDEQDNEIARSLVNLQTRVEILLAGTEEETSEMTSTSFTPKSSMAKK